MVFFPVYSELTSVTAILPAEITPLLEQAPNSQCLYTFQLNLNVLTYFISVCITINTVLMLRSFFIITFHLPIFCTSTVHESYVCLSFCLFPKSPPKFLMWVWMHLHVNTHCNIKICCVCEREKMCMRDLFFQSFANIFSRQESLEITTFPALEIS